MSRWPTRNAQVLAASTRRIAARSIHARGCRRFDSTPRCKNARQHALIAPRLSAAPTMASHANGREFYDVAAAQGRAGRQHEAPFQEERRRVIYLRAPFPSRAHSPPHATPTRLSASVTSVIGVHVDGFVRQAGTTNCRPVSTGDMLSAISLRTIAVAGMCKARATGVGCEIRLSVLDRPMTLTVSPAREDTGRSFRTWPLFALPCLYGSAASRRPSPMKLNASTTMMTGTIGSISQG